MGKDLRGKEIGEGVTQSQSGLYKARYRSKSGKRPEKSFEKLTDAKKWLIEMKYKEEHCSIYCSDKMTLDVWYDYWIDHIKRNIRATTKRNYQSLYSKNIKDLLGNMPINKIKALHCQEVLNEMSDRGLSKGSQKGVKALLGSILLSACDNDMLSANPMKRTVETIGDDPEERITLSRQDEQKLFSRLKKSKHYYLFVLVIQTGLRVGEVIGLKWSDIDFVKGTLTVNRSVSYIKEEKKYVEFPPKTKAGHRTIPLTQIALNALMQVKQKRALSNQSINILYADYVFTTKSGLPVSKAYLDNALKVFCEKEGIAVISMHNLRHTFASRCIEAGMRPKSLQKILGHSDISITMNRYVHTSEEEIKNEMQKIEKYA